MPSLACGNRTMMMKRVFLIIAAFCLALTPANAVFAAPTNPDPQPYDPDKIIYETTNNVVFRQNGNETGAACAEQALPPTTTQLDTATLNAIKNQEAVYRRAETTTGIMWEVLAALDYRESNNRENAYILGGEELGTPAVDSGGIFYSKYDSIIGRDDPATGQHYRGGAEILKGKQPIYGVDPTKPMTFIQLQQLAITYNRGSTYKSANVPPDQSPYVMNEYDADHMNMVFPNIPPHGSDLGETLRGRTESRYGFMTVFANLIGAREDSGAGCIGGGVGEKVDYTPFYPALPAGTLPDSALCKPWSDRPDFKLMAGPPCVSFLAMDAAYKQVFNKRLPVGGGGGYRTAAQQIACGGTEDDRGGYNPACTYYRPDNDPPEHLWGTAIDFSGPMQDANTSEHKWLVANGPTYGWFWPNWASGGRGGNAGVVENWHFAYYFAGHNPNSDRLESYK
jgi:hypothetical protein